MYHIISLLALFAIHIFNVEAKVTKMEDMSCKSFDYPFIVAIADISHNTLQLLCSGVLMHEEWVLTAASCILAEDREDILIVASHGDDIQTIEVLSIEIFPKYEEPHMNDICLLKISPARFDFNVASRKFLEILPAQFAHMFHVWPMREAKMVVVKDKSAWRYKGHRNRTDTMSLYDELKDMEFEQIFDCYIVEVNDYDTCKRSWHSNDEMPHIYVCSQSRQLREKFPCTSSIGGPVFSEFILVGVVAEVTGCNTDATSIWLTRMDPFMEWIKRMVYGETKSCSSRNIFLYEIICCTIFINIMSRILAK